MKRFVVFVGILLTLSMLSLAQERMTFKGVSFDNTVENFANELEKKGFKEVGREGNTIFMEGPFLNENRYVGIIATERSNLVYMVNIMLDVHENWSSLKGEYESIKELYEKKYGKGDSTEKFLSSGDKMRAVWKEECEYFTRFATKTGGVVVGITNTELPYHGLVMVMYMDTRNSEKNEAENLEDI
ncbi:hypothetical protein [Carboxylicivirga marina]|uniref:hypothetical protein n=1 Tax=Carboxylicivirga marina TaxID=2800988 RepID=UPI002595F797|nr:hypothetical protein [uncultured Carboxylicivirga sp.]